MAEKWPKDFSSPKKGQNDFGPKKNSVKLVKKWPKMAKICFYGLKRVKNVVFGPVKKFSQIGQNMAENWPKYVF